MSDCPCLTECSFFNDRMAHRLAISAVIKQTYCRRDSSACARLRIHAALGAAGVPADLFPCQIGRAERILAAAVAENAQAAE